MKIALHACTDEVQVSWSADDDVCGSPSRGEKGGYTDCVSDEACVVIRSDAKTEPVAACCARPVDVSVAVRMSDQQERLPVSHKVTLLSVGYLRHHPALTSICR